MRRHWQILTQESLPPPGHPERSASIFNLVLKNRGLTDPQEIDNFLNPPPPTDLDAGSLGFDQEQLKKTLDRLNLARRNNEQVIVFGDYDCDGIVATAILWEALNAGGLEVMPYLPHRLDEGFGLTTKSLDNLRKAFPKASLIITVDTGITNVNEVDHAKKKGFDVIITDHHQPPVLWPRALAIIHNPDLAGAGVAWYLARLISPQTSLQSLDILTIATIADLVPLIGPNRAIVYHGLQAIRQTQRAGLRALIEATGLGDKELGVYEVSHILAPRLNASGRLQHPLDSLRLLCTKDAKRAARLAQKLEKVNQERQRLTETAVGFAKDLVGKKASSNLIFLAEATFHEGIIGLIASRLVDEFSRPAVVVSKGETISKASARSIPGLDLTQAIKEIQNLLINGGGHPLAGGFTAATCNLGLIQEKLQNLAGQINPDLLKPRLAIDLNLGLGDLGWELFEKLTSLKPFGIGNPSPVFSLDSVLIDQIKWVGKTKQHLKFSLANSQFWAIGYGWRDHLPQDFNQTLQRLAFTLEADLWNGTRSLILKIKDLQI